MEKIMKALLFSVCLSILALPCFGQSEDRLPDALAQADSLFKVRKYTESFKIYEHLLYAERQASPAMLLRMSFIKEGLGNSSEALYYLNLYYLQTADRKVLSKMEELATKEGLFGYDFSDWEFIQTIFYRYFMHFVAVLSALALLMLAIMYYQKFKLGKSPIPAALGLIFVLCILFYTLNFGKDYGKSLVNDSNTYIMTGPSAGAEVIAVIGKGHRVEVGSDKDVWTQIEWKGQKGFVKQDKLKPISF
ncbi:SH3 domain-containing protein [Fulvivirga sp. RKSG066]|nr:SH3 domain-containing protein [Fulvivirga aurantia]